MKIIKDNQDFFHILFLQALTMLRMVFFQTFRRTKTWRYSTNL